MKLTCQRDGLLLACQLASAALAARSPKDEITSTLKAVAEDERLTLIATNMTVGLRYHLRGVTVEEAGEAIFPAHKLVSILRESLDESVHIDADAERCLLTTDSGEFEMPGESPDGFPDFPEFVDENFHELKAGDLRKMIRQTIFTTHKEDGKYAMRSVLWEPSAEGMRLVATDGRRVAVMDGPATLHGTLSEEKHSHLVPREAMNLLEKNLHDDDEIVKVSLRGGDALFHTPKSTVWTQLTAARFAPYRDILPKKVNAKVELPVEAFTAALRQAAVMTDEESKKVTCLFDTGKLTLQAQGGASGGRSKVAMPITYDAEPIEICFDPALLVDMLRALDEEESIRLDMEEGTRPALFRAGEQYLYLVMPLT